MRDAPERTPLRADTRGVSETLGHILVFSLILFFVSVTVVTGLAGLEDTRDFEEFRSADRAYDILAENFAAIYERDSPSRATEIDLGNGQIQYGEPTYFNVSNPTGSFNSTNVSVRPIEYRFDEDRALVYEAGAVFREQSDGAALIRDPPFLLSDSSIHIPLVQTLPREERAIAGTTVLIRGESTLRSVPITPADTVQNLSISIRSPRAERWAAYLEGTTMSCGSVTNNSVECSVDDPPSQVYVTFQRIIVSFDR